MDDSVTERRPGPRPQWAGAAREVVGASGPSPPYRSDLAVLPIWSYFPVLRAAVPNVALDRFLHHPTCTQGSSQCLVCLDRPSSM